MGSNERRDEAASGPGFVYAVTPLLFYGVAPQGDSRYVQVMSADEAYSVVKSGRRAVSLSSDTLLFTLTQLGLRMPEARFAVDRAINGLTREHS